MQRDVSLSLKEENMLFSLTLQIANKKEKKKENIMKGILNINEIILGSN